MTPWLDDGDTRPIWLTKRQATEHGLDAPWEHAPAEPTLTVEMALNRTDEHTGDELTARIVLRALGMPNA